MQKMKSTTFLMTAILFLFLRSKICSQNSGIFSQTLVNLAVDFENSIAVSVCGV